MKSKIYFGHVQHNRLKPKINKFKYGIFMMYLDLDELPTLFDRFLLWSVDKVNLASFKSKNYLIESNSQNICNSDSIKSGVRNEVEKQTGALHKGPIRMLTHLSYFGYCFNPVTFYYCFNESGQSVDFIVAQINNTPWDERYCYVIDNRHSSINESSQRNSVESAFDKQFHVSPFLPMNMQYFWRFTQPGEQLSVYMKNTQEKEKIFDVTLRLKSQEITTTSLAKALIKFPLMTWQVVLKIYWQSLILVLKKIPFFVNPTTENSSK
jgi:DUF1365 family protein